MKRLLITVCFSAVLTVLFVLIKVPISQQLSLILFTVSGILFSIAMSQLMAFDLSRVVNEKIYTAMVSAKKQVRKDLMWQLVFSGIAFLGAEVLPGKIKDIQNALAINIVNIVIVSFNAVLIYSFFYFVSIFQDLSEKKLKLDDTIRRESIEE